MSRSVTMSALRLVSPMTTAHGSITERHIAVATLESDGVRGCGEAAVLPGFGLETQTTAEIELDRWVATGREPDSPAAKAAVAAAEASLEAARHGLSLSRHLNATSSTSVDTQVVVGDGNVYDTERAAARAIASGFSALKLKVAARSPADDIARIGVVRAAAPAAVIRLDANGGWDHETAQQVLVAVGRHNIDFVEEPTPDISDFERISQSTGIPVALDEHANRGDIVELAATSRSSVVVLKPAIVGGPVMALELARRLTENGVRVVVGSFMDGPVGLSTAAHVAAALSGSEVHGLGTAAMYAGGFPPWLIPVDGVVHVPLVGDGDT